MSKSKKKLKTNAVDIIISILLIIIILVFVVSYNFRKMNISRIVSQNSMVEISLLTELIDDEISENIVVGDKLVNPSNRRIIGTVTGVYPEDTGWIEIHENNKNSYIKGKALRITYIGNTIFDDNHYYLNDDRMIIGEEYNFIAPQLEFSAKCISINTVDTFENNAIPFKVADRSR